MATLLDYALTTVADVKETLGIASGDNSKNNLIIRKINQATQMIEGYCQRRFKQTNYVEYYSGGGGDQLLLRNCPVITSEPFSVQARATVRNNDDFNTVGTDLYFIDENAGIINAIASFYGRWDEYKVTYTAGFATIPDDIAEACATLAAYLVTDPSTSAFIAKKREGSREVQYTQGSKADLLSELGLNTTLDKYVLHALSGQR
jgi:hypothetical protein